MFRHGRDWGEARSSGERTGLAPKPASSSREGGGGVERTLLVRRKAHTHAGAAYAKGLGRPTGAGESPVADESLLGRVGNDPEYHGARETLWEAGGTTLQGANTPGHR